MPGKVPLWTQMEQEHYESVQEDRRKTSSRLREELQELIDRPLFLATHLCRWNLLGWGWRKGRRCSLLSGKIINDHRNRPTGHARSRQPR